jgi:hypothetical protein
VGISREGVVAGWDRARELGTSLIRKSSCPWGAKWFYVNFLHILTNFVSNEDVF